MIDLFEHVLGQAESVQRGCCGGACGRVVIWVGNRAAALPGAFPQRPLTPIAADVMSARQVVSRHQIRAEQKALGMTANQVADRGRVGRDLAHLPLGGAGVEVQMRIVFEQFFQMVGVFGIASHVGPDPEQIWKQLQHSL